MNIFKRLFSGKQSATNERESRSAVSAFLDGQEIWRCIVKHKITSGTKEEKLKEAVKLFDEAIQKGFDDSIVFSLRGNCLNDLGFYFDALDDYTNAINRSPKKGIAENYHMRSLIKHSILDYEGSMDDIKEAIRLSKMDNDDARYWNDYAKSTGFASAADFYTIGWLGTVELAIEQEKRDPKTAADLRTELEKIPRRPIARASAQ